MYVCNCNGIREREVRAAIEAGATRPAEVFRACDSQAQCARCVCDMRKMIGEHGEALRYAAEKVSRRSAQACERNAESLANIGFD